MGNGHEMDQKLSYSVKNGSTAHKNDIFSIGTEGNQVEIDSLNDGTYRVICRDHFSENFVDYYVDEKQLKGLADFILKYLENK